MEVTHRANVNDQQSTEVTFLVNCAQPWLIDYADTVLAK